MLPFTAFGIYCFTGAGSGEFIKAKTPVFSIDGLFDEKRHPAFSFEKVYLDNTIAVVGLMLALLFVCLSRERNEDEYIGKIREISLVRSLWISSLTTILASLFTYDFTYLYFMIINIFLILITFAAIFNVSLYKFNKTVSKDEE